MKSQLILFLSLGLGALPAAAEVSSETTQALLKIAKERGLSTDDLYAAASTYTPTSRKDEFVCLNSGGQAASMIAYGVPSMRILKYVPTGAPDSAAAFNYDQESKKIFAQGAVEGAPITWADTHHPSFSETDGKYDGKWAFINDKANPRIFVVDLRDFETKQIVSNPIFRSDHGGAFVTPNTEYVIEGSQYAAPPDRKYYPLTPENFNKYWRGGFTFHKFDNEKGRILPEQSFTIIAPPYSQDLSDAGKGESYGYSFTNSFCSERYVGGIEKGRPPFEAGCSTRDTDYLHVIDWKRAEQVIKEGKAKRMNNHTVIPLDVAAAEGVMVLIPEPKSPHGADVSPDGRFIIVAGKLDTHASVFDIRKIKALIAAKDYAGKDPYGVPILDMQKALHGQVELGLGPLHTQFDAKTGIAYTSLYIDSVVARWDYLNLKVLDKVSVHYNIGHLVSMQGDSQDPRGRYVIALNKLAIDRFNSVGPLHPQNHQLIDTSGEKMRVIYDLPLPMGEPHYTVCIDAKTLKTIDAYEAGTDSATMSPAAYAVTRGKERAAMDRGTYRVFASVSADGGLQPRNLDVVQGSNVELHITNTETTPGKTFKVTIGGYNALGVLPPGKTATLAFKATQAGTFNLKAELVDSVFETRRFGQLQVKPNALAEKARLKQIKEVETFRAYLASGPQLAAKTGPTLVGQEEFENYGCGGCHQPGREVGGPDLVDVNVRRDKAWLVDWIVDPEKYYDDPSIAPLIKRFGGVKMPDQNVPKEDAEKIVAYLESWKSTPAAATTAAPAAGAEAHPGESIYRKSCFACHDSGVGGAPKLADKTAWKDRMTQGSATLYKHAISGFQGKAGFMPPRGACADCTDDQLKEAVNYMAKNVE
jgi:nitrous-oxide reductase